MDGRNSRIGGLYHIISLLPDGYNVAADTAFEGNVLGSKIVKILKEGQIIPDELPPELLKDVEALITTARQAAW